MGWVVRTRGCFDGGSGRIALLACACALVLGSTLPAIAEAASPRLLSSAEGVAMLARQRQDNGIPGRLTDVPRLSRGCHDYLTLYQEAPGQYPHEERSGQPGYTPAGAEAASRSDLAWPLRHPAWTSDTNPWWDAKHPALLHLSQLFNPAVTTAWYGESEKGVCMGTSGERSFATPRFYAFPSEAGLRLPPVTHADELPWTPQVAIGIPQSRSTGPNFIVWPEGTDARIAATTLVDVSGRRFPVRAVPPTTPAPPSPAGWPQVKTVGGYSGRASFIVPTSTLLPGTAFTLTVRWKGLGSGATFTQRVHFTTT